MRICGLGALSLGLLIFCGGMAAAQEFPSAVPQPASQLARSEKISAAVSGAAADPQATLGSFDEVIERVILREHLMLAQLRNLRPVVEAYIQNLKTQGGDKNPVPVTVPVKDQYFLGRLDMSDGPEDISFVGQAGIGRRSLKKLTGIYALHFQPLGFVQMVALDTDLSKKDYEFTFVRREFLGDVRCLVIDMQPKADAPPLAFNDRMFFPDEQSFRRFDFRRRPADEEAADAKALELLKNSPYKDKLGSAGLFLEALQQRAPALPNLIRPHLGNGLAAGASVRMSALLTTAPQLDEQRLDQIAALPLGGRIRLDPWTDRIELAKTKPVALALASEKRPFEITPFFPYLSRVANGSAEKVALVSPPAEEDQGDSTGASVDRLLK